MHEVEEALGIILGRLNGDLATEDAEGDDVLCLGLGIVGPGQGLEFRLTLRDKGRLRNCAAWPDHPDKCESQPTRLLQITPPFQLKLLCHLLRVRG